MARKKTVRNVGDDLIESLTGLVDDLESGRPISSQTYKLDIEVEPYTPSKVKKTRQILGASQSIFATFLGVSTKTVSSWEAGQQPSLIACRFMDEINSHPKHWRSVFAELVQTRQPVRAAAKSRGAKRAS